MTFIKNIFLLLCLSSLSFLNAQNEDTTFNNTTKPKKIGFKAYKPNSVLKDGTWYKISVPSDGVYKIDYNFIQNEVGISPSSIKFDEFGVFGQGMGLLPEFNGDERVDDLNEIGIKIKDINGNNIWDATDYIVFYAKGPHLWENKGDTLNHVYNIYTDIATYFISTDKGSGREIPAEASLVGSATINSFDDAYFYEEDVNNLIATELAAGSGRNWYGEEMNSVNNTKDIAFNIPDLLSNQAIYIKAAFAAKAAGANSTFQVKNNGSFIFSRTISAAEAGTYAKVANSENYTGTFNASSGNLNLNISFTSGNTEGKGWIDYVEIVAKRALKLSGSYTMFRSLQSLDQAVSNYSVSGVNSSTEIWDVTKGAELVKINGNLNASTFNFGRNSNVLRTFVAVDLSSSNFAVPSFVSKVENQNLHGLRNVDYVMITVEEFLPAAQKLSDFHSTKNGLDVVVVLVDDIYNEFSSGQQDLTAIRDFLKMFYDRNLSYEESLKYVLLLGDGSFDYKDRIENNQNFIPTFQSYASLKNVYSFCTDDYIGFLDDDEGLRMDSNPADNIDIAIGRIPASTLEQAENVVDKIIYYKTNESNSGWKNELTFVADDEDNNLHFKDAEEILSIQGIENIDYYNIDKIYIDAYSQKNAAGGDRYPDVVDALLRKLFTGTFFVDYTGHGGPTNWAQERIFNIQDIKRLENKDKLPLFMTATCDFSPFDDPTISSAGEELLLNPNGGAIAMLSTTRLVFSHSNKQMNKAVLNYLFQEVDGRMPTVGEILQQAKNQAGGGENNRKFVLLGDPAMTLEYPKYEVVTTKINGKSILQQDTLKALSKVTIEGGIMDETGALMTNFDGIVYTNVYDKESTYSTKGNDIAYDTNGAPINSFPADFNLRNNVIFKGKSSVINGKFSFEFIVPKDINYSFGNGKITYYAEKTDDPNVDAHGYTYQFKVGGTDPNAVPDNEGPEVIVYMNDENFRFGGITDENPILLVKLKDESGINTIGNGVGHDLIGILNENTQEQYLLNDYYEASLDDFTSGNITYLLNQLDVGRYSVKVKAWDVHNNPGEGFTEFVVSTSALLAIDNVLNYPNPFTTSTSFVFEHNRPNEELNVIIQIFTANGKLVKTINENIETEGYRLDADKITWDGTSDSGAEIGRGLYMYKVNVRSIDGYNAFKFEKLVILK